ncbi:MAG: deaminase [bacterium]|nr:deaminase [bacterium]
MKWNNPFIIMEGKNLVIHIPVIHRGYLDFFKENRDRVSGIYLIDEKLLEELSEFKPDIASLNTIEAMGLLEKLGFQNISVLSLNNIDEIKKRNLILIQDEISRNLYNKYLPGENVEWASVFLRWDKSKILSTQPLSNIPISKDTFDIDIMKEAYKESEKSSDWWRHIGAVLVKDEKIILYGNNKDIPSDHTPYQVGEVRDFFMPGERQDLASAIHAEQKIIAEAAKNGISVKGLSLYATTFPCPVCAKLIACSGIKNLFFAEGGSNFDAKKVLESAGVKIIYVPVEK